MSNLRTSGNSVRSDVKAGECFSYVDIAADTTKYFVIEKYDRDVVRKLHDLWSSLGILDKWDWSDASAKFRPHAVIFIPRWDVDEVAAVKKNDNMFPHKCLLCGTAAYVGFNSTEHRDEVKCSAR